MLKSDVYTRICTQLTFDLILGLWGISRLGIHPISFLKYIKITLSMDAKMYSKMPTEFFFQALDGQLYYKTVKLTILSTIKVVSLKFSPENFENQESRRSHLWSFCRGNFTFRKCRISEDNAPIYCMLFLNIRFRQI